MTTRRRMSRRRRRSCKRERERERERERVVRVGSFQCNRLCACDKTPVLPLLAGECHCAIASALRRTECRHRLLPVLTPLPQQGGVQRRACRRDAAVLRVRVTRLPRCCCCRCC